MFMRYNLGKVKTGGGLAESAPMADMRDLALIIESFEKEALPASDWELFEAAKMEGYRIYGLENGSDNVYVKIMDDGNIVPCYFQNHKYYNYRLFEADSIEEAIRLYDNSYGPVH